MNALLIDDHALFREGFKLMLERLWPEPINIAEVGSGAEAFSAVAQQDFELIFLDLALPDADGMEALSTLRQHCPATAIIVLSGKTAPETIRMALSLGAQGYIPKSMNSAETGKALEQIMGGEIYAPDLAAVSEGDAIPLSGRRLEVFAQICAGLSNREIATHLGMSENTVRVHTTAIFRLLKVRTRTEAAVLAKRKGWF